MQDVEKLKNFIDSLNIKYEGFYNKDRDAYIIDLPNSDIYGKTYIKLENNNLIELLDSNQLVTEEGSSLLYQAIDLPYMVNLLADWAADKYQIIINKI